MKTAVAAASVLSLAICLAAPLFFFLGWLDEKSYKLIFLLASLGWFLLAAARVSRKEKT